MDKICVVIDLDETLVHSSFKVGPAQHPQPWVSEGPCPGLGEGLCGPRPSSSFSPPQPVNNADFIIPVEIDGVVHQVRGWVWGGGGGLGICLPDPRLLSPILKTPGGTSIDVER